MSADSEPNGAAAATARALDPTEKLPVAETPAEPPAAPHDVHGILQILRRHSWPTLKYLTTTEVHTYAFSVAANAILSFFPAIVLMLTLTKRFFHSDMMYDVVLQLLRDYLPSNQDFIIKNMRALASRSNVQVFSLVMLVISSTGIFLPLEVALNQVWGIRKNRSYIGNQLISLALACGCGLLALTSIALAAGNQKLLLPLVGSEASIIGTITTGIFLVVTRTTLKVLAILASIGIFFLIYWALPNGKIPARAVLPAAIITGVLFEIVKYIYMLALPLLDFQEVYGPFSVSVTLIFWAFISGLLLLGGAYLSAAEHVQANVEAEQKE